MSIPERSKNIIRQKIGEKIARHDIPIPEQYVSDVLPVLANLKYLATQEEIANFLQEDLHLVPEIVMEKVIHWNAPVTAQVETPSPTYYNVPKSEMPHASAYRKVSVKRQNEAEDELGIHPADED